MGSSLKENGKGAVPWKQKKQLMKSRTSEIIGARENPE